MLQAFDVLERLDPTQQVYEAKRGAAVGAFQMVVAGKEEVSQNSTASPGMKSSGCFVVKLTVCAITVLMR